MFDPDSVRKLTRPQGLPFHIGKIGHIVINVRDVAKSTAFYTQILGFQISDVYPEEMVPGGMVFLRCNTDHHGIALVGSMDTEAPNVELNHIAFEVPSLDDVIRARDHLRRHQVPLDFAGRRRAGCQIAVEFRDPDNHRLEIFWGLDRLAPGQTSRPPGEWKWAHSLEEAIQNPVKGQDTRLKDKSLMRELSDAEIAQRREHSLATQAKKLGYGKKK